MQIFLSHSSERSRALAEFLFEWLPKVNPAFDPWLDKHDLGPGKHWSKELKKALSESGAGIV